MTDTHTLRATRIGPADDDTLVVAVRGPMPRPPIACPDCGNPATIEWRDSLDSTDGPIEHVKIVCSHRHWFLMPASLVKPLT
jgi:hypothetical protein